MSPLVAKFSLEQCQNLALEHGGKKTIADIRALIAYDRIAEVRSSGRPQLNAHADYMTAGDAKKWQKNEANEHARVSLVIPLYNFGLTREAVNAQKKNTQAARFAVDQVEQEIRYAVIEAYFELLIYGKLQWIVQESIKSLEIQLQITEDFVAEGLLQRNEALVVEVQLAQLHQDILEAGFQRELAEARLNRLMGIALTASTEIEDLFPEETQELYLEPILEKAKCRHPELLILRKQTEAARHAMKAEKAHLYPNLYAFSNYSTTSDYALPYRHGLDAGIGIDISFYDGGNTYAKLRRINKELCELEWRIKELEKDIELNIRSAFLAIKSALGKIPVAIKGVNLAEENLLLTKNLFEEGLVSTMDIINDDESLSQARLNYYKSLYSYHLAKANLIYSAGAL